MGRPSGSSTVPRMAPVEASCDKRRTLSSKKPSTMAMRAEWRRAEGMSPTSGGMGLEGDGETMEFYHPDLLGECVGGHKIVCDRGICAGKGKMSFELRAWNVRRRALSYGFDPVGRTRDWRHPNKEINLCYRRLSCNSV